MKAWYLFAQFSIGSALNDVADHAILLGLTTKFLIIKEEFKNQALKTLKVGLWLFARN